jgi:DNA-binding transcriptional LysR family regulator
MISVPVDIVNQRVIGADGLAYTFEQLALPHIRAKTLKRVLSEFSPTFPGFYLYYPSRRQQPSKLKAFVEYALAHSGKR